MPAIRGGVRRNVIIRVPKVDVKTRRGSAVSLMDDVEDREKRRSTSPSKRLTMQVEAESVKQAERKGGHSYEYAAQATSTAEWNSLLIWARRQRGPQWDTATGLWVSFALTVGCCPADFYLYSFKSKCRWQVDQGSSDYYSFGNDPARHTKLSIAVEDESSQVANVKLPDEGHGLSTDEGDGEGPNESHGHHGYGEDSPPIGPGNRRSRLR